MKWSIPQLDVRRGWILLLSGCFLFLILIVLAVRSNNYSPFSERLVTEKTWIREGGCRALGTLSFTPILRSCSGAEGREECEQLTVAAIGLDDERFAHVSDVKICEWSGADAYIAYSDESGQSFRLIPVSCRSEATLCDPQFRVTGLGWC